MELSQQNNICTNCWICIIFVLPNLQKLCLCRFRFLAVRDIQCTSRLQIGSIDLYAKTLWIQYREIISWIELIFVYISFQCEKWKFIVIITVKGSPSITLNEHQLTRISWLGCIVINAMHDIITYTGHCFQ